jgi:molecular chaperone DnaJ
MGASPPPTPLFEPGSARYLADHPDTTDSVWSPQPQMSTMPDRGDAADNYYAVLGVHPDASAADIEASYRERVKQTHPDRNDDPDASEQFQRVKRAREVLTDPDERDRYDRLGHEQYVDGTAGAGTDNAGTAGGASGRRTRERERARWTTDGWTDAGSTGTSGTAGAGTGGTATGHHTDGPTGSSTRRSGEPGPATAAGTASADLGDRITIAARALERYRFDIDPKTAVFGMATFMLYPVFLASSVAPGFPIAVNVLLSCCLLCTVGYLLATPEVGVPVFGAWSLFGPIMFIFVDRPLLSWAGFFLVATTLVPFGLSLMVLELLRLD